MGLNFLTAGKGCCLGITMPFQFGPKEDKMLGLWYWVSRLIISAGMSPLLLSALVIIRRLTWRFRQFGFQQPVFILLFYKKLVVYD